MTVTRSGACVTVPYAQDGATEVVKSHRALFIGRAVKRQAKTIVVRPGKDFPVNDLKVTSSNLEFSNKSRTGQSHCEFKIDHRAKTDDEPGTTILTLQPDNSRRYFTRTRGS